MSKSPKKLYYRCPACGRHSRYDLSAEGAKGAASLLAGPLLFLHREQSRQQAVKCLNCGNKQGLEKKFLDSEPANVIHTNRDPETVSRSHPWRRLLILFGLLLLLVLVMGVLAV